MLFVCQAAIFQHARRQLLEVDLRSFTGCAGLSGIPGLLREAAHFRKAEEGFQNLFDWRAVSIT